MTTTKPRLTVTLRPSTASILASMAKQEHKSLSCLAKELILEALECREDVALSALAKSRDTGKHKTVTYKII